MINEYGFSYYEENSIKKFAWAVDFDIKNRKQNYTLNIFMSARLDQPDYYFTEISTFPLAALHGKGVKNLGYSNLDEDDYICRTFSYYDEIIRPEINDNMNNRKDRTIIWHVAEERYMENISEIIHKMCLKFKDYIDDVLASNNPIGFTAELNKKMVKPKIIY